MTSKLADDAARWLEGKESAMVEALVPLVETNSFTENVAGGRAVGGLLRELFRIEGLEGRVIPSTRYADHLVFTSDGVGAPVALVGHLDTVFPPGVFEGFRREGEIACGPGVLDMKGGLVVIAFALKALASQRSIVLSRIPPLRLVVVADEEIGSPEGQQVITDAIVGARAALVFEAGRKADAIITRRKGTGAVHAIAHGVAAHAGNQHQEGKNAIWALARFIDRVQGLTDYTRGVTVNVGKIAGGQGKNTVPDHAEAWLDLRFCTIADGEATVLALHKAAEVAAASVEGTRIEISGGVARPPLERTDASAALCARYASCAKAVGLGDGESALLGGGSDASTSAAMGIPSIDGLGPRGTGFHTKDERIEVSSLVPKAQALVHFLVREAEERG